MRIYVANANGNNVTTYLPNGNQTTPTITAGVSTPAGLAVDASGKIYVANFGNNTVTTYLPNGTQTTPTITANLNGPEGVAVDANGKIYVANSNVNTVTTYLADGTPATPTINNLSAPTGVAVDSNGKIYVANFYGYSGPVATYKPNGHETTPTITTGLNAPYAVTVVANPGRIYVANFYGNVTTYKLNGTETTPTITGLANPAGVATDSLGNIYVTDVTNATVTVYKPNGQQLINRTITTGLNAPTGIAVH
jgi:DNA-binding beta-propeller fold protein YncE